MTSRLDVPSCVRRVIPWVESSSAYNRLMVIPHDRYMVRVTVTLDPLDVDLLDRLAALEESNRSAELRSVLVQLRPMLKATVEAFEAAMRTRDEFSLAAAQANILELQELLPEVQRIQAVMVGSMARLEGAAAARATQPDEEDPRSSNHGGHTPTKDQS